MTSEFDADLMACPECGCTDLLTKIAQSDVGIGSAVVGLGKSLRPVKYWVVICSRCGQIRTFVHKWEMKRLLDRDDFRHVSASADFRSVGTEKPVDG